MLGRMTDQTPLGRLLEDAREGLRISQNEAARRASSSGTTWRNVIRGYAEHGGNQVEFRGAPETVARFARVVGVESYQLRQAGRADAADALQDIELDEKYGDKTTRELQEESEAIAAEIHEMLRRQGRDLDSRQRRVLDRWSKLLIETLDDFDSQNNAS